MAFDTIVVGLGLSNLSAVKYLLAKGIRPLVVDSRENPPLLAKLPEGAEFRSGSFDSFKDEFAAAKTLVTGPGVPVYEPAIKHAAECGAEVIGDIELFVREAKAPVVGITGANGKSTVTTLVGLMAEKAGMRVGVGGNIGIPALDLLEKECDLYVLELSSFQLETTKSLKACACAILNVTEDHMDRYEFDIEKYAAAKKIIHCGAQKIVANREDARTMPEDRKPDATFGGNSDSYGLAEKDGDKYLSKSGRPVMKVSDMIIAGRHNAMNALAAMALADFAGISEDAQVKALKEFAGLPHRCRFIAEIGGVRYYNDSKATNVGSTLAAVSGLADGLKGDILLLAGGIGKGQDFSPIGELLGREIRRMYCYGRDKAALLKLGHGSADLETMEDALKMAASEARPGDAVLLAPACASMDQFRSFEHRGDVFEELVRQMAGKA